MLRENLRNYWILVFWMVIIGVLVWRVPVTDRENRDRRLHDLETSCSAVSGRLVTRGRDHWCLDQVGHPINFGQSATWRP